jgi:cytoskeletal protein CcmA (bactofilin family)
MPKISQLPPLETITTGSIIPVVENGITQKLSVGKLFEFLSGALDQTFSTEIELMLSASSLVTTSSFNSYTSSAGSVNTSSLLTTSSFNAYTSSVVSVNTSSLATTASLNSYTSSNDGKWNTLGGQTGSFVTEAETGSFVTNVSMFLSKSIFDTYTGSAANAVSSAINAATSSLSSSNAALDNIQLFTSSFNTFTSSVNSTTQSLNNFTASVIATGSNINSFTASVNGKTGSFATTGSNTFTGTQTINGNLVVTGSLTAQQFIISSSVTYLTTSFSSGSTKFGDSIDDTHQFTGSLNATGSLTVNGKIYSFLNNLEILRNGTGTPQTVLLSDGTETTLMNNATNARMTFRVNSIDYGRFVPTTGNFLLQNGGTFTDNGSRLQVIASGSQNALYVSGSSQFSGSVNISGSLTISGSIVGANNLVTTSSFNSYTASVVSVNTSSLVTTSSFNTFSSSVNTTTASLNSFTASVIATGSNINSFTESINGKTGSFATTGSNTFIGNQTITGSLNVSGSIVVTGSIVGVDNLVTTSSFNSFSSSVNSFTASVIATGSIINTFTSSVNTFSASVNGKTGSYATTGSNVFIGSQTISGSLSIRPTLPSIGDSLEGGKVAYILTSSDAGYDPTLIKGIIVATSDQSSGIQWYNGSSTTTGATGTAIGTGLSNTNAIIASQGAVTTSYAAGLARAYGGGGYSDWFLPSKDELNQLYLNRVAIGGFTNAFYWSSTEATQFFTWRQNLNTGVQDTLGKSGLMYVRAIRTFSIPALTVVGNTTISGSLTITGSLNISGSLIVTGSARGNVVPITIVSSTASLDMTSGSYFTLTLANTTNTHIRATSITPGVNATLLVTTGTNSSASLSPLLLQPSGSSYTASLGSGKKDVLSLVAFDSTNMYVVSTKAMQ